MGFWAHHRPLFPSLNRHGNWNSQCRSNFRVQLEKDTGIRTYMRLIAMIPWPAYCKPGSCSPAQESPLVSSKISHKNLYGSQSVHRLSGVLVSVFNKLNSHGIGASSPLSLSLWTQDKGNLLLLQVTKEKIHPARSSEVEVCDQ